MSTLHRLLLVEDDLDVAEMLSLYLGEHGYAVHSVPTGEEALTQCREIMPHLSLMDISLPDIDGYEVCRRLRMHARTAHIPVIFLTQRSHRADKLAGLSLGADDYITKPFDLEELRLRIRNAIERIERETLSDPLTGLPGPRITAEQVERAASDPQSAVLDIVIKHAEPFRDVYGPLAMNDVHVYMSRLVLGAVNALGSGDEFVGTPDWGRFTVICSRRDADAIGRRVVGIFNATASKHYTLADRERGYLLVSTGGGERREPFMQAEYTVWVGRREPDVPTGDEGAAT